MRSINSNLGQILASSLSPCRPEHGENRSFDEIRHNVKEISYTYDALMNEDESVLLAPSRLSALILNGFTQCISPGDVVQEKSSTSDKYIKPHTI